MRTFTPFRLELLLSLIAIFAVAACGKKGGPKPPELLAPSPVKFLTAVGDVEGITLTWEAPEDDASGNELENLDGFVVERSDYLKDESPDYDTLSEIKAEKGGEVLSEGKKYSYKDSSVEPGKKYQYGVLARNEDGLKGAPGPTLRVTFAGQSSVVEAVP